MIDPMLNGDAVLRLNSGQDGSSGCEPFLRVR